MHLNYFYFSNHFNLLISAIYGIFFAHLISDIMSIINKTLNFRFYLVFFSVLFLLLLASGNAITSDLIGSDYDIIVCYDPQKDCAPVATSVYGYELDAIVLTCKGGSYSRRCDIEFKTDPCDDKNICTKNDVYTWGKCVGEFDTAAWMTTCNDNNPGTIDRCSVEKNQCVHTLSTNSCDDGVVCTVNDHYQYDEQDNVICKGDPFDCSTGNPCKVGTCYASGGNPACNYSTNVPAGTHCPTSTSPDVCDGQGHCGTSYCYIPQYYMGIRIGTYTAARWEKAGVTGDASCKYCNPEMNANGWSFETVNETCEDNNPCTEYSACDGWNGQGKCIGTLVDNDGDGYYATSNGSCSKIDCNDNDPNIHPGTPEHPVDEILDHIDNNCNNLIDEGFSPPVCPKGFGLTSDNYCTPADSTGKLITVSCVGNSSCCTTKLTSAPYNTSPYGAVLFRSCLQVKAIKDRSLGNICVYDSYPLEGNTCDDYYSCSKSSSCRLGECKGADYVTCNQLDQCHAVGQCNAMSGICSNPVLPNGEPCDDGVRLTINDQCTTGTCRGASVECISDADCPGFFNSNACQGSRKCDLSSTSATYHKCIQNTATVPVVNDNVACTVDVCTASATGATVTHTPRNSLCTSPPDQTGCYDAVCDPEGMRSASGCRYTVKADKCVIGGVCYSAGARASTTSCQECKPSVSKTEWSPSGTSTVCHTANASNPCDVATMCNGQSLSCPAIDYSSTNGKEICNKDSDGCTVGDKCSSGSCVAGTAPNCSDQNDQCNTGSCKSTSSNTFQCVKSPIKDGTSCDDGVSLTINDQCTAGSCKGTSVECISDTDCPGFFNSNACQGNRKCDLTTHKCVQNLATVPVVNDNVACTVDACTSTAAGANITHTPNSNSCTSPPDQSGCYDAVCDAVTGCRYTIKADKCVIGGVCYNRGAKITPDNPCQVCNPDISNNSWTKQPTNTICRNATGDCDMADTCLENGTCPTTDSVQPYNTPCPTGTDSLVCTRDICDGTSKTCTHPIADNTCKIDGKCYTLSQINPLNQCQICNSQVDKEHWQQPEKMVCSSDGNACTKDQCIGGVCNHAEKIAGCCNTSTDCSDGKTCTLDSCNTTTHTCSTSTPADWMCTAPDLCTTVKCDPTNAPPSSTTGCVNAPVPCNDGNVCTTDKGCNPQTGGCVFEPVVCNKPLNNCWVSDACNNAFGCQWKNSSGACTSVEGCKYKIDPQIYSAESCDTGKLGVCKAGTLSCLTPGGLGGIADSAGSKQCKQNKTDSAEICDGLDNDCDGSVDEDTSGAPLTNSCYLDGCGYGTQTCQNGSFTGSACIVPDTCIIGGRCYRSGVVKSDAEPCFSCRPGKSKTDWSTADEGTATGKSCDTNNDYNCLAHGGVTCHADGSTYCKILDPFKDIKPNNCGLCGAPNATYKGVEFAKEGDPCSNMNSKGCSENGQIKCNVSKISAFCQLPERAGKNECGVCGDPPPPTGLTAEQKMLIGKTCGETKDVVCHGGEGQWTCNDTYDNLRCVYFTPMPPDGAQCDDGNSCTKLDACRSGTCKGTSYSCDDGLKCTEDTCKGDGTCAYNITTGCTIGGSCIAENASNQSNPCQVCNSSVSRTAWSAASKGTGCRAADPLNTCDVASVCDGQSMTCPAPTANDYLVTNDKPCNADTDGCTHDDKCSSGVCIKGATVTCNDDKSCTEDKCTSVMTRGINNDYTCSNTVVNGCLIDGVCVAENVTKDGDVCSACKPSVSKTAWSPNTGFACDDGNACSSGDVCNAQGTCVGVSPISCDDGNVCTNDTCDLATGCKYENNTLSCDDGNACTTADTCSAGSCVGGVAPNCDDGNVCTNDSCDPRQGCQYADNTKPCDDGDACTTVDACQSGSCVGSKPVSCAKLDQCHVEGKCNSSTGVCDNPNAPDGTGCNDEDACSRTDACQSGSCVGGDVVQCEAKDVCHIAGECNPATGVCSDPPATPVTITCGDEWGGACVTQMLKCSADGALQQCPVLADTDSDSTPDCVDECVNNKNLTKLNACGTCNDVVDADSDNIPDECDPWIIMCPDPQANPYEYAYLPPIECANLVSQKTGNNTKVLMFAYEASATTFPVKNAKVQMDQIALSEEKTATATSIPEEMILFNECLSEYQKQCGYQFDSCENILANTSATEVPRDLEGCNPPPTDDLMKQKCSAWDTYYAITETCWPVFNCSSKEDPLCVDITSGIANDQETHDAMFKLCSDQITAVMATGACLCEVATTSGACNDQNPCTIDACDINNGQCTHNSDLMNGLVCDNGNACEVDQICSNGECKGGVKDCDDGNTCTTDSCDMKAGCLHDINSEKCDSGDVCTENDICMNSNCVSGTPKSCDDNDACTADYCDQTAGGCVNSTISCDDQDICTADNCDAATGCSHTPNPGCCKDVGINHECSVSKYEGCSLRGYQSCQQGPDGYPVMSDCVEIAPLPTEVCDGVDNNCDGQVDEGFDVGVACSAGLNACKRDGVKVCSADKLSTVCNVVAGQPSPEVCNNIDDDCDSIVDNGIAAVTCGSGPCSYSISGCDNGTPKTDQDCYKALGDSNKDCTPSGNRCITSAKCSYQGNCIQVEKECDISNKCHPSTCEPSTGECVAIDVVCHPPDDCTDSVCNPATGRCDDTPIPAKVGMCEKATIEKSLATSTIFDSAKTRVVKLMVPVKGAEKQMNMVKSVKVAGSMDHQFVIVDGCADDDCGLAVIDMNKFKPVKQEQPGVDTSVSKSLTTVGAAPVDSTRVVSSPLYEPVNVAKFVSFEGELKFADVAQITKGSTGDALMYNNNSIYLIQNYSDSLASGKEPQKIKIDIPEKLTNGRAFEIVSVESRYPKDSKFADIYVVIRFIEERPVVEKLVIFSNSQDNPGELAVRMEGYTPEALTKEVTIKGINGSSIMSKEDLNKGIGAAFGANFERAGEDVSKLFSIDKYAVGDNNNMVVAGPFKMRIADVVEQAGAIQLLPKDEAKETYTCDSQIDNFYSTAENVCTLPSFIGSVAMKPYGGPDAISIWKDCVNVKTVADMDACKNKKQPMVAVFLWNINEFPEVKDIKFYQAGSTDIVKSTVTTSDGITFEAETFDPTNDKLTDTWAVTDSIGNDVTDLMLSSKTGVSTTFGAGSTIDISPATGDEEPTISISSKVSADITKSTGLTVSGGCPYKATFTTSDGDLSASKTITINCAAETKTAGKGLGFASTFWDSIHGGGCSLENTDSRNIDFGQMLVAFMVFILTLGGLSFIRRGFSRIEK